MHTFVSVTTTSSSQGGKTYQHRLAEVSDIPQMVVLEVRSSVSVAQADTSPNGRTQSLPRRGSDGESAVRAPSQVGHVPASAHAWQQAKRGRSLASTIDGTQRTNNGGRAWPERPHCSAMECCLLKTPRLPARCRCHLEAVEHAKRKSKVGPERAHEYQRLPMEP